MHNKLDRFQRRSRLVHDRMTSGSRVPKPFRYIAQVMIIGLIGHKAYERPYLSEEVRNLNAAMLWVPNVHGNLLGGVLTISELLDILQPQKKGKNMLKNYIKNDDLLSRLANNSGSGLQRRKLLVLPTTTDNGARMLHKEDVILALTEVGLGPKLVNQVLVEMGFTLETFPSL